MASNRKEVTLAGAGKSIDEFIGPNDLKKGQEIVGTYVGSWTGGEYNTTTHKIELENGQLIGLNGSGQLNKKLSLVKFGTAVAIVYEGKEKIMKGPNKGKSAHQFKVFDLSADNDPADADEAEAV